MAAEVCFENAADQCVVFSNVGGKIAGDVKLPALGPAAGDIDCESGTGLLTVILRGYDRASTAIETGPGNFDETDNDVIQGGASQDRAVLENTSTLNGLVQIASQGLMLYVASNNGTTKSGVKVSFETIFATHPDPQPTQTFAGIFGGSSWESEPTNQLWDFYDEPTRRVQSARFTHVDQKTCPAGETAYLESRLVANANGGAQWSAAGVIDWQQYALTNQLWLWAMRSV